MKKITIINNNMGNLRSISNALEYLEIDYEVTNDTAVIKKAEKLILPGVGSFHKAMQNLKENKLLEVIKSQVLEKQTPILGICLGMQLLASEGEEGEKSEGLGFIPGKITIIKPNDKKLLIPHYGWVNLENINENSILLKEITNEMDFYFVHSFCFEGESKYITSTYNYSVPITATIENGHIFGTQFHPEKSKQQGLHILQNFARFENEKK